VEKKAKWTECQGKEFSRVVRRKIPFKSHRSHRLDRQRRDVANAFKTRKNKTHWNRKRRKKKKSDSQTQTEEKREMPWVRRSLSSLIALARAVVENKKKRGEAILVERRGDWSSSTIKESRQLDGPQFGRWVTVRDLSRGTKVGGKAGAKGNRTRSLETTMTDPKGPCPYCRE